MKIAIDIDDTIAQFSKEISKFLKKEFGITLYRKDMKAYHLEDVFGITKEQMFKIFLEMEKRGIIAKLETVSNAPYYIEKLYNEGHEIVILTSRIFSNKTTLKWLADNNIKYHKFYRRFKDKTLINYDVLVDDDPFHIKACEKNRIYSILYSQPWNQSLKIRRMKYARRATSWHQVYRIINELGAGKRGY